MSETRIFAEAATNHCQQALKQATELHEMDTAKLTATVAIAEALLSLRDPIQRLASAAEKVAEWHENHWSAQK